MKIEIIFAIAVCLIVLLSLNHGYGQATVNLGEIQIILGYCYQHADRPNPVQDLVDKGLVSANFTGQTCGSVKQTYDEESEKQELATKAFSEKCEHGNLTPSQYPVCKRAGYIPGGFLCLFEQDRAEVSQHIVKRDMIPPEALGFIQDLNLSLAQQLTPAEQEECIHNDAGPRHDKDGKIINNQTK